MEQFDLFLVPINEKPFSLLVDVWADRGCLAGFTIVCLQCAVPGGYKSRRPAGWLMHFRARFSYSALAA